MVKKLRKIAESGSDGQMAKAIRKSAQQIWLAGLGAFSKAREDGAKAFETLVEEGRSIQSRTREVASERIGDVAERVSKASRRVGKQATESWDRLEQVFEERVSRALSRLGLPTAEEIAALTERVDRLAASVAALGGEPESKRPAARKPRASGVPTARASTARVSTARGSTARGSTARGSTARGSTAPASAAKEAPKSRARKPASTEVNAATRAKAAKAVRTPKPKAS